MLYTKHFIGIHGIQNWILGFFLILLSGCGRTPKQEAPPSPLPVTVFELKEVRPSSWNRLTASVASWKTEDIGFEVSGRIQFVVEPETDVSGELYGKSEKSKKSSTLLARLDPTRYELAVTSAQASIKTEESRHDSTVLEIEKVVPAQINAAEAERKLAEVEFKRAEKLIAKEAISQSEYDRYQALLTAKTASKEQLLANLEQKKADLSAIDSKINQLEQDLAEANRDLKDTRLVSAYPAQVAQVHAIPGAYVERGTPVCTVQMMDPMRVDVEVSSQMARKLNHGNRFPVFMRKPDGNEAEMDAFVYMIDPTADPETRTFTVTFFVRNNRKFTVIPPELKDVAVARTEGVWRFVRGLGEDRDRFYTEEKAIHKDKEGTFVYKIMNRDTTTLGQTNPVLEVQKIRVKKGEDRVAMLGIVTFVEVELLKPEELDPDITLITGQLALPQKEAGEWDGKTVIEERRRWKLRPGDLVNVELDVETPPGFYVPLNSIRNDNDKKYIYSLTTDKDSPVIEKKEVDTFENVGKLIRIQPVGEKVEIAGRKVVLGQAHFLQDGEKVTVVEEVEVRP